MPANPISASSLSASDPIFSRSFILHFSQCTAILPGNYKKKKHSQCFPDPQTVTNNVLVTTNSKNTTGIEHYRHQESFQIMRRGHTYASFLLILEKILSGSVVNLLSFSILYTKNPNITELASGHSTDHTLSRFCCCSFMQLLRNRQANRVAMMFCWSYLFIYFWIKTKVYKTGMLRQNASGKQTVSVTWFCARSVCWYK